jgi:hypothetical protein
VYGEVERSYQYLAKWVCTMGWRLQGPFNRAIHHIWRPSWNTLRLQDSRRSKFSFLP